MKMPEKHDRGSAILGGEEQGIRAILAFAMAYLRGRYNGGAFQSNNRHNNAHYISLIRCDLPRLRRTK